MISGPSTTRRSASRLAATFMVVGDTAETLARGVTVAKVPAGRVEWRNARRAPSSTVGSDSSQKVCPHATNERVL